MEVTSTITYTLACILAGEVLAMPLAAQVSVGNVALNRYETGLDNYLGEGFYAWGAPTPATMLAAHLTLKLPDITGGAMYALSKSDIEYLGFREGDIVYIGPAGLESHLFYKWQEGN